MPNQTSIQWYSKKVNDNLIKFLKKEITEYELAIKNKEVFDIAESMHQDEVAEAYDGGTENNHVDGYIYYNCVYND